MKEKNMKKITKVAIMICIITVCIVVVLISVLYNREKKLSINQNKRNGLDTIEEYAELFAKEGDYSLKRSIESNLKKDEIAAIKNCIQQYLDIINLNNSIYYGYDGDGQYTRIIEDEEISEDLYDIINKQYAQNNNINKQNALSSVKVINESFVYSILDIKKFDNENEKIKSFAVHILVQSIKDYKMIQNSFLGLNIDENNFTFSVEPLNNINDFKEVKQLSKETSILKNEFNQFEYNSLSNEEMIKEYLNVYKRVSFVYPEYVYNLMSEEYKENRFPTLNDFINYIKVNSNMIKQLNIDKYLVNEYHDYTQYVCLDKNKKYIFINENSPMNFTLILDNHSIDTPEFIERYDKSDLSEKVGLNIEKIMDAINTKDYKYVYNKLDESFKQSNFENLNKFEAYMKSKLYENNTVSYSNYQTNSNTHIYTLQIKDSENLENKTINMKIYMQLKEGTDFVTSFSIE